MAFPTVSALPSPPLLTDDESTFDAKALAWTLALPGWTNEVNAAGDYVETKAGEAEQSATDAQTAQSAAEDAQSDAETARDTTLGYRDEAETFKDQAEAAVSTLPEGTINDAIIGPSTAWSSEKIAQEIAGSSNLDIGAVTYSFADLTASGDFVRPGMTYLQSAYPDLFGVIGIGEAPATQSFTAPSQGGDSVVWSDDGSLLFFGSSTSPYLHGYSFDGTNFTVIPTPSSVPTDNVRGVDINSAGTILAAAADTDGLYLYSISGTTLTKLPDLSEVSTTADVRFDKSGSYLLVVQSGSPMLVYSVNGTTFTKLADISDQLSSVLSVGISESGQYIATGSTSGAVRIHKNNGDDTYSLYQDITAGSSNVNSVILTEDGSHLMVGALGSPYIFTYENDGVSFNLLPTPTQAPNGAVRAGRKSRNDRYFSVAGNFTGDIITYIFDGQDFTSIGASYTSISNVNSVSLNGDGTLLAVCANAGSSVYRGVFPFDTETEFYVPDIDDLSPQQVGDWTPGVQAKAYVRAQ